jgi:hypothetical protein
MKLSRQGAFGDPARCGLGGASQVVALEELSRPWSTPSCHSVEAKGRHVAGRAPVDSLTKALDTLKKALTQLSPSGEDGFEGLLAVVLEVVTGQQFRLASSGSQGGQDGAATTGSVDIAFEAKLYTGSLRAAQVHGKITAILGSAEPPDLWILGATVAASTQVLTPMLAAAHRAGLTVLILDWKKGAGIPALATACALAPIQVADFLKAQISDSKLTASVLGALSAISADPRFRAAAQRFTEDVSAPSIGLGLARTANRGWLDTTLGDRRRAKAHFGQALAPKAQGALTLQPRLPLVAAVQGDFARLSDNDLTALLGIEGSGKSWLLAQSWLEANPAPLLLLVAATDLSSERPHSEFASFLVTQFICQTGDSPTEITRRRWESRLVRWQAAPRPEKPRFILCVDGLNQQPRFEWPRWIDGAAVAIEGWGGRLILTCREQYYRDHVSPGLITESRIIKVPEWADAELDEILREHHLEPADLRPDVRERLRNPRLLSVGLGLLRSGNVADLSELSADRILLEHARASVREGYSPVPVAEFIHTLATHADQVLARVRADGAGDHMGFQTTGSDPLAAGLLAVTGEHFFRPVVGDATRYTLTNDGLDVALGLALIRSLQSAKAGAVEVSERLREILEPVEALDKTSIAVAAAVRIAAADSEVAGDIRQALLVELVRLQNLDNSAYPSFVASVRGMVEDAMEAMAHVATSPEYFAHADWLLSALRQIRCEPEIWPRMDRYLREWLVTYSGATELGVSAPISESARRTEELERSAKRLRERLDGLSVPEQKLLATMRRQDRGDPGELHRLAARLLAGQSLAPFAEEILAAAFATALNSSLRSAHDALFQLLLFNRADWRDTRSRLLELAAGLELERGSVVGRWTLTALLAALATPEDSDRHQVLVEELTAGREKFDGWRLVEDYCSADPCDPQSIYPANIDHTADRFRAIDFETVRSSEVLSDDDNFLSSALPGVARFRPEVAIETIRRLASAITGRKTRALFLGLSYLKNHASLLRPLVPTLLEVAREQSASGVSEKDNNRYEWVSAQYALLLAFAHLDGEEQVAALASLPPHGSVLLDLLDLVKPAGGSSVEALIEKAIGSGEVNQLLTALGFASSQEGPLSARLRALVLPLLAHSASAIRSEALAIAGHAKDLDLLAEVVRRGWTARTLSEREAAFEIWYGSIALVEAARVGLLSADETLDRIGPELFGHAVRLLGARVVPSVAKRIEAAVRRGLNVPFPADIPPTEVSIESISARHPPLRSLADRRSPGLAASLKSISETPEQFQARQTAAWARFAQSFEALSVQEAQHFLERPSRTAIRECAKEVVGWAEQIADALENSTPAARQMADNLALCLAVAVAETKPGLARRLFEFAGEGGGYLTLTHGLSKRTLDTLSLWEAADDGDLDDLRISRLENHLTDGAIAEEVLAATTAGRRDWLEQYVREQLMAPEPVRVARALMIVGYGEPSDWALALLKTHAAQHGFLGRVATVALAAYERNVWARHWWTMMQEAASYEAYWAASILFLKVVDGRVDVWRDEPEPGAISDAFSPLLRQSIERRIEAWAGKRKRNLFGQGPPDKLISS